MMGRWTKGSGGYPNFRQPQLFRKGVLRDHDDPVHEATTCDVAPARTARSAIRQYPFRNFQGAIAR